MEDNKNNPSFLIQKVYTKDISFEIINSPACFKEQVNQTSDFNIDIHTNKLEDSEFELDLTITITTKNSDNNNSIYIVEVTQSGIFTITATPTDQIESILNTYCANVLFPYAKSMIDSTVLKGGFLPINLAPINFDAIYMQKKIEQESQQSENKH